MSDGLKAELFIGGTFGNELKHITLFVRYDDDMTKAINVVRE
jgi:hypothetical protein